jgi:hypothetical protein
MDEPQKPTGSANAPPVDLMKMFEAPAEETLGAAERALVDAGRTVFKELEKLLKSIGLYGADHQGTQRFKGLFRDAMRSFVSARPEGVTITVGPYEFTVVEQSIYQNTNPEKNFVYKFFQDGVRRLIFEAGVTEQELDDFISILLMNWDDPALFEDDTVTLMWAKDFQHLRYRVIESFEEEGVEGSEHTVEAVVERVKQGGSPPAHVDRIVSANAPGVGARGGAPGGADGGRGLGPGQDTGNTSTRLGGGPTRVDLRDSLLSDEDLARFVESPFAMDEHEFEILRGIVLNANVGTLEKFIEILFKVGLVSKETLHERVMQTFERITDTLLESGRLEELVRIFARVRGLVGPQGELLFENVGEIDRVFERLGTPERVQKIVAAAADPALPSVELITRTLRYFNPSIAPSLARSIGVVPQTERRAALFDLLPDIIAPHLKEIGRILQSCDGPLAHDLMRVLRGVDHPDVNTAVNAALNNPDAAVRLEALGALPPEKLPVYLNSILHALKDRSKVVRSKALHLLARIPTPAVHSQLMQRIRDKDFGLVELDEKRRFFVAAALTGNPVAWFMEVLEDRSLLQRKADEELRACAAMGLALRVHAPALPLFEKESKRSYQSDVVREACAWALQHVRQGREERTRQLYDILFRGVLSAAASTERP